MIPQPASGGASGGAASPAGPPRRRGLSLGGCAPEPPLPTKTGFNPTQKNPTQHKKAVLKTLLRDSLPVIGGTSTRYRCPAVQLDHLFQTFQFLRKIIRERTLLCSLRMGLFKTAGLAGLLDRHCVRHPCSDLSTSGGGHVTAVQQSS